MNRIEVLIAEDHEMQRRFLTQRLGEHPQLRMVGAARDGVEAVEMVWRLRPQVLVLDMVMPRMDGYAVMEQLQQIRDIPHPAVIALTSLDRDDFIRRAIHLCASYYMVKPVDPDLLARRILSVCGEKEERRPAPVRRSAEEMVHEALVQLGVPANLLGYRCLRCALMLGQGEPELLHSLSRRLYPRVAQEMSMSPESVERAIRHAIVQTWNRGGDQRYSQFLGPYGSLMGDRPTNGEFLTQVSECLQMGWSAQTKKAPDRRR